MQQCFEIIRLYTGLAVVSSFLRSLAPVPEAWVLWDPLEQLREFHSAKEVKMNSERGDFSFWWKFWYLISIVHLQSYTYIVYIYIDYSIVFIYCYIMIISKPKFRWPTVPTPWRWPFGGWTWVEGRLTWFMLVSYIQNIFLQHVYVYIFISCNFCTHMYHMSLQYVHYNYLPRLTIQTTHSSWCYSKFFSHNMSHPRICAHRNNSG